MKRDRKKLIELFFWGILFLVCMAVSVFYMVRDTPENMPIGQRDMEVSVTEGVEEDTFTEQGTEHQEPAEEGEKDLPSGVIEEKVDSLTRMPILDKMYSGAIKYGRRFYLSNV